MENKTPMQELIKWNNSRDRFSTITWIELNSKLTELLEKEKQVIEKCCIDMVSLAITKSENNDFKKGMEQEFNEYFDEKFKN